MNHDQVSWLSSFLGSGTSRIAPRLPGAYRATVVSTDDPLGQGRIQVIVPDRGEEHCWTLPCRTSSTQGDGPAAGSSGWVMFEHGDPDFPIWIGARPD